MVLPPLPTGSLVWRLGEFRLLRTHAASGGGVRQRLVQVVRQEYGLVATDYWVTHQNCLECVVNHYSHHGRQGCSVAHQFPSLHHSQTPVVCPCLLPNPALAFSNSNYLAEIDLQCGARELGQRSGGPQLCRSGTYPYPVGGLFAHGNLHKVLGHNVIRAGARFQTS